MNSYLKFDYNKFNDQKIKDILKKSGKKDPKVLYLSSYNPNYVRTETLLELFKRNNIKFKAILTGKSFFKYSKLIYNLIKFQKDFDLIFVGFRGHEIMPLVKLFTSKPIIFDSFVSIYDTLCDDRKVFSKNSIFGRLLKWYDQFLCRISLIALVDTKAHKEYYDKTFKTGNIDYLYIGSNESLFRPTKSSKSKSKVVFWYGQANPLQGVDIILKAADLVRNKNILFRLVGPIRKKYSDLINNLNLTNVEFLDFIPYNKLPIEINKAHICLGGHFSNIDKAKRVIAGKTYQFLSCNKVTIIGENQANMELFKESDNVKFVQMNSPKALANKIRELIKC